MSEQLESLVLLIAAIREQSTVALSLETQLPGAIEAVADLKRHKENCHFGRDAECDCGQALEALVAAERLQHVQRWYEQDQIIRDLREELRITVAALKLELQSANVSAATRSDLVVADGVTLPVGEKPALANTGIPRIPNVWENAAAAAGVVRDPRCECGHEKSHHCFSEFGDEPGVCCGRCSCSCFKSVTGR